MCSIKTIPTLVLVHRSFTLDAVIKVTQLIMEGRQVRNKTEEKFATRIPKQTAKENRFAPTGEISKMASQKRQASSFLARFCFLTQLYAHLQDLFSSFHSGSKRENTSDKSTQQLVQLFNSISSAPVGLSHRIGWGEKTRADLAQINALLSQELCIVCNTAERQRWPSLQCFI